MREYKYQKTKTIQCKDNGRSADATSANFILGCRGEKCAYCYVSRWDRPKIYVNTNTDEILNSIHTWVESQEWPKTSNQVHDFLYGIDIS